MAKDLKVEIARMESKLAKLKTEATAARRRDDSRRKIVIGAAILAGAEKNPDFARQIARILGRFLTRDADRRLFESGPLTLPKTENISASASLTTSPIPPTDSQVG